MPNEPDNLPPPFIFDPVVANAQVAHMEAEAVQAGVTIAAPILPPESNDLLLQAIIEPGNKTKEGTLVRVVALPWFEIRKEIQRDPQFLFQFAKQPRQFERFIAGCYRHAGYKDVVLTPRSRDLGIDVIVSVTLDDVGRVSFVDQVKAYSPGNKVQGKDVRELAGVLRRPNYYKGIITTTSTFAPCVYTDYPDLIPDRIVLKDHDELLRWLQNLSGHHPT